MRNHMIQHNSQEVVVYRSRGEQMTDKFLWEESGIVYICGLMLVTAILVIAYDKVRTSANRARWKRIDQQVRGRPTSKW